MKTTNALDLCGSVEKQLGSYLKKQGLAVLRCDNFHVEFANTHTKLVFEQYEETALRFWFFDLAASDNKPFNLPIFLDAILGSPNSLSLRPAPERTSTSYPRPCWAHKQRCRPGFLRDGTGTTRTERRLSSSRCSSRRTSRGSSWCRRQRP